MPLRARKKIAIFFGIFEKSWFFLIQKSTPHMRRDPKEKKNFFLLQNPKKVILNRFWVEKKFFDFWKIFFWEVEVGALKGIFEMPLRARALRE